LVLLSSVGTVLLSILLATRLAGRRAGIAAGLFAALLPALVTRGSIVIVDTPAALFSMASLLFAARLPDARNATRASIAAGVAAGLAFTSKYPAGLCILVVLVVIAFERKQPPRRRAVLAVCALGAAAGTAVLTMPALLLRLDLVRQQLRLDSRSYQSYPATISYLRSMADVREVGWVLVIFAALGLAILARSARWRWLTLGFVASALVLYAYLGRYRFQPFRNFLPLLPFFALQQPWVSLPSPTRSLDGSSIRDGPPPCA
jgi:4-amino-4-deoxy-L-arabinose transferase-like glycosyltransferase